MKKVWLSFVVVVAMLLLPALQPVALSESSEPAALPVQIHIPLMEILNRILQNPIVYRIVELIMGLIKPYIPRILPLLVPIFAIYARIIPLITFLTDLGSRIPVIGPFLIGPLGYLLVGLPSILSYTLGIELVPGRTLV